MHDVQGMRKTQRVPGHGYPWHATAQVKAQATPWRTVQMTVRLAVNVMQSLALFGLMSAKWPETFEQSSSSLQIFVLDMKNLSLNCLLGGNSALSYVASTVVFPLVLLWLVICHAVSRLICSRKCGLHRWKWPFTFNTMGLFLQLGFGTMAAVSMKPMMCYSALIMICSLFETKYSWELTDIDAFPISSRCLSMIEHTRLSFRSHFFSTSSSKLERRSKDTPMDGTVW